MQAYAQGRHTFNWDKDDPSTQALLPKRTCVRIQNPDNNTDKLPPSAESISYYLVTEAFHLLFLTVFLLVEQSNYAFL